MTEMTGEGEDIRPEGEDLPEVERGKGEYEPKAGQLLRGDGLFICSLCNSAASDMKYIASNDCN
jgi:hypothetical protein